MDCSLLYGNYEDLWRLEEAVASGMALHSAGAAVRQMEGPVLGVAVTGVIDA